ncbi:DNA repair protein RadA/Sms [Antricoccus suffuscus]|uniref:DNA repair protein RadA n=1 Tax=Antricoccus suffuscus TaxID=1629062 RepID=A0A2T1A3M5_9ACTN|nr:DNA repair protein RadA [Antricoccus suffuscus]PRZ43203.1 DNA repair protein RadA/Sms [Antricoccus suffuscus]
MSAKTRASFKCSDCGNLTAKWFGRCPECQAWGTIEESGGGAVALRSVSAGAVTAPAQRIGEVDILAARARPTGVDELDRVLGGGLVPGSVVLVAGEPGVGKSTLLLDVASKYADRGSPALVVTGEESAAQVRLRAERTGNLAADLYLAAETDLAALIGHVDAVKPGLLVVDSIQTIASPAAEGTAGGMTQIRAVAAGLIALAKERGIATIIVGHVTKDGQIAGPRLLEHLVDVVLHFEGEQHSTLRLIRAVKNRYGPADEVGCFEMVDDGIVGLPDPSGLFLTKRENAVPGTCITITVEGRRPIPAEVQSLVTPSPLATPRRAVSGLDSARVAMVLAVLSKHATLSLATKDVFCATVGGVKITEPAADLSLALAIASAELDIALPVDLVAIGEVGLAGDLRRVRGLSRRIAEARRMGFRKAIVPPDSGLKARQLKAAGIQVTEARDLHSALLAARLVS